MKHATKNSALVCWSHFHLSLDFVIYKTIISSPYCLDYCYKIVEVGNMTTKLCHMSYYNMTYYVTTYHLCMVLYIAKLYLHAMFLGSGKELMPIHKSGEAY